MTRCFESVLAAVMMSDIAKFNQFMSFPSCLLVLTHSTLARMVFLSV
jgi:hypothetical protein